MGKLISIEGLDGSGKATQSKWLEGYLNSINKPAKRITFPNYDSPSSSLVKMYLNGELSSNMSDVNAYAASSFYACDRYASYMTDWKKDYEDGKIIVADRYTDSNAIHQTCKLQSDEYDEFLKWLYDYEYNHLGLPQPDLVIFLRVSPEISQRLMNERYHNDETKKDIHESNIDYINKCYDAAMHIASIRKWEIVNCDDGQNMLHVSEISSRILMHLNRNDII